MNGFELNIAMQYIDAKYLDIAEASENGKANLKVIEGEIKMNYKAKKKYTRAITAVAMAACLLLSLGITAFASDFFGIRTMFKAASAELPDDAAEYIHPENSSFTDQELSCLLTESLCDEANIMAIVSISGGSKYIMRRPFQMPYPVCFSAMPQ